MKVRNMISAKGNKAANQFIIEDDDNEKEYFQSYTTIIGRKSESGIALDPQWDCSKTTAKYTALWLGISTKEIRARIKDGKIKIKDLN